MALSEEVARAVERIKFEHLFEEYWEQNEFVFVPEFFNLKVIERYFIPEVETVRSEVHRNYIPGHKKGGSVSYFTLRDRTPNFLAFYRSSHFMELINRLVRAQVLCCPESDPHACALYFYTEPGDHIGFHYDTSYYRGARYTVLLGLVQRTEHCRLVCRLYHDDRGRRPVELNIATPPGSLVVFNGDRLWHAVTPLGEGEERVMLTMEYVTNPEMGRFKRFVSNMKDAIAYFGPSVFWGGKRGRDDLGCWHFS